MAVLKEPDRSLEGLLFSRKRTMAKKQKDVSRLLRYIRKYRKYFLAGAGAIILTNAFAMLAPWLVKNAIESIENETATSSTLFEDALLIVIVASLGGFFMFFLRRTIIWASRFAEYDLKNELAAKLTVLSKSFYNETPTGDIIARLSNDVEAVRMMIGPAVMHLSNTIVAGSIALTLMVVLSPKLTLIALIPFPLLAFTFKKVAAYVYSFTYEIQEHFSTMSAFVQENLAGVRVVKAYNQEANQTRDFEKLNDKYVELNLRLAKLQGLFHPIVAFEVGIIMIIVLYFGGSQVMAGDLSLGVLVAFMLYLSALVWPVMAVGWTITLYQRGLASLARIEKILLIDPEVKDAKGLAHARNISPDVKINDLTFSYPGTDRVVLDKVSLEFPAGSTTAIVGRTGSGKSTVVEIIVRAYRVPDGYVSIGERDINSIPLQDLRAMLGYVPQESFLFSDSLSENISLGLDSLNPDDIQTAAIRSGLDKDIDDFPKGYDTIIGERGVTLSGGQKQRTALARAVVRDPKILILDDAFSAVDTATEEQILAGLKDVMESRTTILISHRISTTRKADLIHVLDEGRVIDSGTHEFLLRSCKLYADIVERQELEEQLERI